jgi:hypothetical protein
MAHPFINNALDYNSAESKLGLSAYEQTFVTRNRLFYAGDHWQEGEGYNGPRPSGDDPLADSLWEFLHRGFTSKNVIKEGTDRQADAILGRVPDCNFTPRAPRLKVPKQIADPNFVPDPANPGAPAPMIDDPSGAKVDAPLSPEEQILVEEASAAWDVFFTRRKPHRIMKRALKSRLWGGRSYLRVYVPPKFRRDGVVPFAGNLNEAILRVFIDTPDLEDSVVMTDAITQDAVSLVRYERGEDSKVIETSFVDDRNLTFVGTIEQDQRQDLPATISRPLALLPASPPAVVEAALAANPLPNVELSDPLDLNGHITTYEMNGDPLITEQVVSNNKLVNLSLTMASHVIVESGFSELAVTNVEFETERVNDPQSSTGFRDKPKRLKRGMGAVLNFVGQTIIDPQSGKETLATPSVNYKEPSPITTFADGKLLGYRNCLEEMHQVHALIAGDATPSGESRITALADFATFSLDFKEEVDACGEWLAETVLYWASVLMNKPGRFNSLRASFDSKIDLGRLSAEERAQLLTEVEKKVLSRESYMMIVGRGDPRAEFAKIKEEDAELNQEATLRTERARLALDADRAALTAGGTGSGDPSLSGGGASGGGE